MRKKKKILYLVLILMFLCTGCNTKNNVERNGKDGVVDVAQDDVEMNKIIKNARESIPEFLKEFRNPKNDKRDFNVKYPFKTDAGSDSTHEHIWLSNLTEENGKFKGVVSNDVMMIKRLKNGDTVEFDINTISDWMYYKNNKIYGGKSEKYLIEQIPEEKRTEEEKNMLKIFN